MQVLRAEAAGASCRAAWEGTDGGFRDRPVDLGGGGRMDGAQGLDAVGFARSARRVFVAQLLQDLGGDLGGRRGNESGRRPAEKAFGKKLLCPAFLGMGFVICPWFRRTLGSQRTARCPSSHIFMLLLELASWRFLWFFPPRTALGSTHWGNMKLSLIHI